VYFRALADLKANVAANFPVASFQTRYE